jgi:hypothetical protein
MRLLRTTCTTAPPWLYETGRQWNDRTAALRDLNGGTTKCADAHALVVAHEDAQLANLGGRINRRRKMANPAREFTGADDVDLPGLVHKLGA